MLPVIISTHHRPKLLKQTLDSLHKNSYSKLQIIVIDDSIKGFADENKAVITDEIYFRYPAPTTIGQSKLKGADLAKKTKYIYFSDDDVYYLPNWDKPLLEAMEKYNYCIVGGRGVHGIANYQKLSNGYIVGEAPLQTGYSMLMKREDWDLYGHFPNYNEDSWLCYQMKSDTGKPIGVIDPPVLIHCGKTSLNTKKAYDYKEILESEKLHPELFYE